VVRSRGGDARDLTAALDRPCGDATLGDLRAFAGWDGPTWSADSSRIFVPVSDRGSVHLYSVDLASGELRNLTPTLGGGTAIVSFSADRSRVASAVTEPLNPGDLQVGQIGASALELRRLTDHNRELLAELPLAQPQEFSAASDGGEVHGWLIMPAEASAAKPVPLLLYVHGGPHTQYGWGLMHELQYLCSQGMAVLYTNPRGSRGYGVEHTAAIRGDWGGADYQDLMAAVDHAVTLPGIDAKRLGVTGGSYGGYMTNWMIGKTDRFRAGVTQRSVVNLHSMGGTCDFNFSDTEYFGGNTWDNTDRLLAQSPLSLAAKVNTPLLIIHSEGDLRCPIEQAEQLFAALKVQGKTVEFIRYPKEANHGLSRSGPPDLRIDRLKRIFSWFERYLLAP
jgi:dipeptidyl aminopeptidase/acylaminoacyl peptidase